MAVNPIQLFTNLPGSGGAGDYGEEDPRELRRLLAQLLQRDDDVIRHPLQGVANLADTAFKGLAYQQAKARQEAQGKEAGELLAGLYRQMTGNAGGQGNAGPVTGRGMPSPPPRSLRPSDPSPETPLPQAAPSVDDQPIPPGDFGGAQTPENALGMDALDNLDRTLPPAPPPMPAPAPMPAPEVAAPPPPMSAPVPGPSGAPMPMAGGGAPMAGAAPAPPPPVQFDPPEPIGSVQSSTPPLQMQAPAWAKQGPQGGRAAVAAALAGSAPQDMPPTIPTMAGFEDQMPMRMPQDIARPVGAPQDVAAVGPPGALPAAAPPQAISPARAQIAELLASNGAPQQVASLGPMEMARPAPPPESVASGSIIGPDLNYPTKAPRAVPGYDVSDILTGGNSLRSAYGWAGTDKTWQGLGPYEKAAAMALMEADGMRPDDARNALGSMINRAAKGNEDLGAHVSGQIYQPTWEGAQRNRLARILSNPQHGELTQWAERRAKGLEDDPVQGATHFLAPESTMLALERGNPSKYRSWRKWTNFDADAGEYRGVITRDKSHAFLAPEGRYQPDGGRPPPAQTAEAPRAVYDLPQADVNPRVADASGSTGFSLSEDQFKRMLANPRTRPIAQQYLNQVMQDQAKRNRVPTEMERLEMDARRLQNQKLQQDMGRGPLDEEAKRLANEKARREIEAMQSGGPAALNKQFGSPPAGYAWNPDGTQRPISGGPAEKLPSETAAKMGIMKAGRDALPRVREIFLGKEGKGNARSFPGEAVDYYAQRGDMGEGYRLITGAIEGVLRTASGAAVPDSEVKRYSEMFAPTPYDTNETRARKIDALERFISNMTDEVNAGRPMSLDDARAIAEGKQRGLGGSQPPPRGQAAPKSKAEYDALPSGSVFIAPDGSRRVKP